MHIEELKGGETVGGVGGGEIVSHCHNAGLVGLNKGGMAEWEAKRVLIGAGARALFYPTLLYNIVRNKIQAEFRWWDRVDQFILLGAVPFPTDVPRLKELGVRGVITLNESYETLVPTSLYESNGIAHLVIPTRDYYFAPSLADICQAVNFIHQNAMCGQTTYVHCKAGRGRSTTVVLCYLVQYKHMNPDAAYDYVKSIRPRVLLAPSQWQAVHEFFHLKVKMSIYSNGPDVTRIPQLPPSLSPVMFDDGSVVVVTEADLAGYDPILESGAAGSTIWADLSVLCRVRVVGQAAMARISCLWLAKGKMTSEKLARDNRVGGFSIDIHVF